MTIETEYLLHLIYCALTGSTPRIPDKNAINWVNIYNDANEEHLIPLLYSAVVKLPPEEQPSFISEWKQHTLLSSIKAIKDTAELSQLIHVLRERGIKTLLCKGIVLASLYPEPYLRVAGDIDLLIKQADMEKATEVLMSVGYKRIKSNDGREFEYFVSKGGTVIDLQTKVWQSYATRNKAMSDEVEAVVWKNNIVFDYEGLSCETLGVNEHLFYIICHMTKHFIGQGIGIRHLIDLSLYIRRYVDDIDFNNLWEKLRKLKLEDFVKALILICTKHLGLEIGGFLDNKEVNEKIVEALLEDIMDSGVFGAKNQERAFTKKAVMESYYIQQKSKSKFGILLLNAFPPRKILDTKYSYAKAHPVLIPIAWIHRALRYIFIRKQFIQSDGLNTRTAAAVKRINLINDLKIM